jgi:tetratricopeptide (TPR) repeat protein
MKIVDAVIPQVEKLIAEDNWKEAKELLIPLSRIKADDSRITKYLEKAEESDQADYYIGKAEALRAEGDLEQALEFYRKALAFPEVRQQVQQAMDETRIQLVEISFLKGVEYADQELNKQAYDNFMEAFNTMKKLPLELRAMVSVPKAELESYYDNMYFLGQKAADEGAYGQSYLYFKLLYDLVPSYHGLLATKKGVEDKILSRALKSIAVIPFKSPVNEPELGLQVTSTIMQILQRQLSDDIKIIERGALEILLREYELAVAGNLSEEESNPDAFRIKSADFLLMGEVLDSRTETNVQNSKRKVRVKVSQDKVRNIEWEDWYKEAVRLREKNKPVPPEPQKYIFKPVYDYAEYDVAFHEKVSYLSISYRVVETSQGRITFSNTVQSQKESKDEATSGIDLGTFKVPMKAANLPTDIELSNEVRKDAIDRISGEIKNIFKDQDKKYLEQAKKLESSNNLQEAVELYANSILLMKRKGKDVSGVEDKVGKYLDILSAY